MTAAPEAAVEFLWAVGEKSRLRILAYLAAGPASVSAVAAATGLKFDNVSRHLIKMRTAGVVASERDGTTTRYRLIAAAVTDGELVIRRPWVNLVLPLDPPVREKATR